MMIASASLLVLPALLSGTAHAWGATGHRVVGEIAERHISKRTRTALTAILGADPADSCSTSLARAANWPDEIRSDPAWTARDPDAAKRHYINAPPDQPIARPAEGENIWAAIELYQARVADPALPTEERRQAICWLTHLVGDAHQPLHAGYAHDWGGNKVNVSFFDEKTNLHSVWDEYLIDRTHLSYTELADFIDHASPAQIAAWRAAPVQVWLQESRDLMADAYDVGDHFLSYSYVWRQTPVVEARLLQGGHRLAELLDQALDPKHTPPTGR
jgi:hypothetical protein